MKPQTQFPASAVSFYLPTANDYNGASLTIVTEEGTVAMLPIITITT